MKSLSKMAIAVVAVIVAKPHILVLTVEAIVNSAAVKPGIEKFVSETLKMDLLLNTSTAKTGVIFDRGALIS